MHICIHVCMYNVDAYLSQCINIYIYTHSYKNVYIYIYIYIYICNRPHGPLLRAQDGPIKVMQLNSHRFVSLMFLLFS